MIEKELDRITGLLCVVFFVIEGAKMDLLALQAAGLVGVVFIICRSAGKYLGVFFAARHRKEDPVLQYWLGATLISQAGVALALCTLAVDFDPELGEELRAIIFGTVIAFEIAGPILVKLAIIQGGEVPMAEAIRHTSTTPWEEFRAMLNRLLLSTGRNPWATKKPGEVLVSQIMRTHVKGVPTSASFDQLVDYMEHSHDNTFPVINDEKTLVGVIRFNDLRDALFDPELGSLVYAVDLTQTARHVLKKSDTAERALQLLNASDDDAVPVIDDTESKHFIGVVRRRDVMRMLRK